MTCFKLLRGLLIGVAVSLLLACEARQADSLVFAVAKPPSSLHPLLARDAASERIAALIYQPLVDFDAKQQPVPGVITWKHIGDRRYRLRMSANTEPFSNGEIPTLNDVMASLQMAGSDARSPHAATLAHIHELILEEDTTGPYLDVRLSRADPRFAEKLHLGLAPAALLQNDSLARSPLGSGAFSLSNWNAQNVLTLKRRTDGQVVRIEPVPDPTMRALKLLRGEADLLQNDLPFELYEFLAGKPGIQAQKTPGSTFSYIGFNLQDPLTGKVEVRRAIAHAIDREAIVRYLFKGHAAMTNTLLRPEHWAANTCLRSYRYDPAEARRLLSSLGYSETNPLRLSYKTSTDPFRLRIASALQAQLAEVGIELTIASYEWGSFFADIKAGEFQLYSLSWVGIRSPDVFRYIYHSESLPPQGANRGRYLNKNIDRLINRADSLPANLAAPLYREIQAMVHRDLVYVPLWHEHNMLFSRELEAPGPSTDGAYRFLEKVSSPDG